jgi:hypothetical protein
MKTVLIITAILGLLIFSSFFLAWTYFVGGTNRYWGTSNSSLMMDQASKLAKNYLNSLNKNDLAIDEIIEFELNFYIVYYEKSTGIGAFETIIDKGDTSGMMGMMRMMGNGYVRPEQGPNMMWNTKYGMHNMMGRRGAIINVSITENQAKKYAQKYLDANFPGAIAEDVHAFYGYYTIHVITDDKVSGMLSVNSYTGQVWHHNWHGAYIQTLEVHK